MLPLKLTALTEKPCSFLDHGLCPKSLCPIRGSWCRLVSCFTSWNGARRQPQEGTKSKVSLRLLWTQSRPDVTTSNHTLWLPWSIFSAFRRRLQGFPCSQTQVLGEKKKGESALKAIGWLWSCVLSEVYYLLSQQLNLFQANNRMTVFGIPPGQTVLASLNLSSVMSLKERQR